MILNQGPWLKPYVDIDTELRKKAKNDLEDLLKLMNDASFGKNHGICEKI